MKSDITKQKVWSLAWPVIISNISTPILGITNTAVMGRLPDPVYIGAVAIATVIIQYIYWVFAFLRMGTTGITAQAYGAKNPEEIVNSFFRSALIAIGIGTLLIIFQVLIAKVTFGLFQGSEDVKELAKEYFFIRIWGAPATLCLMAITGWLFGVQRTKPAFTIQIFVNVLNITLSIFLGLNLGMKIKGVAYAALISVWLGLFLGLYFIYKFIGSKARMKKLSFDKIFLKKRLLNIFQVNVNLFIRSAILLYCFTVFISSGAGRGEIILASNAILLEFLSFLSFALDGVAQSAEILIGKSIGAKDLQSYKKVLKVASQFTLVFGISFSMIYFLLGGHIIDLMTTIPSVRENARLFLPWMVLLPLISVWCYLLDGVFIGATEAREMRNMSLLLFPIYLALIYTLPNYFGNNGLWLAFVGFMFLRAFTLFVRLPVIERRFD